MFQRTVYKDAAKASDPPGIALAKKVESLHCTSQASN
jgi:hypothetical protein